MSLASPRAASFVSPPPGRPEDGGLVIVDFRMLSINVAKVGTISGDSVVKFAFVFYWTDERLANHPDYSDGQPLPGDLWGPTVMMTNTFGRPDINQTGFVLENTATGRLKRQLMFEATVDNPMELWSFPFDTDAIEVKFMTTSDWSSLDDTVHGNAPRGKIYRLREMPPANNEGYFYRMCWDGEIPEWSMLGYSYSLKENMPNPNGAEGTEVSVNFHVTRKWQYYGYKVMTPLYLLIASSLTVFTIDPEHILERKEMANNMIMAACGLLFVVANELPRLDFLTSIDLVSAAAAQHRDHAY